jgi:hypothetical protein
MDSFLAFAEWVGPMGGLLIVLACFFAGTFVRRYEEKRWPSMSSFPFLLETTLYGAMSLAVTGGILAVVGFVVLWIFSLIGLEAIAPFAAVLAVAAICFRVLQDHARKAEARRSKG